MRNSDSVLLAYLLGAQASDNFEAMSSHQLCGLLSAEGREEATDILLTALAVKIRQIETGKLTVCALKGFIDEVAELRSGVLDLDPEDMDLAEEVKIMNERLFGGQERFQAA